MSAESRARLGWAMYDWSAQPFFTLIVVFVFGRYFVNVVTRDPLAGQKLWANAQAVDRRRQVTPDRRRSVIPCAARTVTRDLWITEVGRGHHCAPIRGQESAPIHTQLAYRTIAGNPMAGSNAERPDGAGPGGATRRRGGKGHVGRCTCALCGGGV